MRLMRGSIFAGEGGGEGGEEEGRRLRLLQMQRERGMRVTCKPAGKAKGALSSGELPAAIRRHPREAASAPAAHSAAAPVLVAYSDSE